MSEARREVAEAAVRWDRAIKERDVSAAEEVLHEEYALVLIHPERAVMFRDQWLTLLPDYVVDEWTIEDQVIDIDNDVAVVLQRVNMKATVVGQDRSGTFVISDLWRRTSAGWKVWRRHSTPLSAGALRPSA
jgi:ketosteroid isomerase-like protein